MIDDIRELFQNLIAPRLEGIQGELKAVNTRIDALELKIDALDSKFNGKFDAVDSKFDGKFDALSTSIGFLDGKLESFRRELSSEIRRVDEKLKDLLGSLEPSEWDLQTFAPLWKVRDVAAQFMTFAKQTSQHASKTHTASPSSQFPS